MRYVDSPIHRVVADGWVQGGDVVAGNGSGGESAFGQAAIPDEGFAAHDGAGVLGMANDGPHTAASQFYVTQPRDAHLGRKPSPSAS